MKVLTSTTFAMTLLLMHTPFSLAENEPSNDAAPRLQQQDNKPLQRPKAGKPPEEAILACQNKSIGSPCQFGGPNGPQDSGYCEPTPDQGYFACNPARND